MHCYLFHTATANNSSSRTPIEQKEIAVSPWNIGPTAESRSVGVIVTPACLHRMCREGNEMPYALPRGKDMPKVHHNSTQIVMHALDKTQRLIARNSSCALRVHARGAVELLPLQVEQQSARTVAGR